MTENPKCPKCKSGSWKAGFQMYATLPHKRQKFICKECGHTFVPESDKLKKKVPESDKPKKKQKRGRPRKKKEE
jgi:transposase-like protein